MKSINASLSLPLARRRFWVISDLQQSDPANARRCMTEGVDDFLSLGLPVDAICYLGDATEGANARHLREMAEMQVEQLARVDAPVYWVMGNHEFDLFRYGGGDCGKVVVPMRSRVENETQWHVSPTLRDWMFSVDLGDIELVFFTDHADPDGAWCSTHGYVQDLRPGAPRPHCDGDAEEREVKMRLAAINKPFFVFSHYAFPGGNRASPLQGRLLPLPENAIAHFYGHCHIGDFQWGGADCLRQVSGIDGSAITQFDCASLENRRGNAIRSAFVEWRGGASYSVYFRNHAARLWEKVFHSVR